MGQDNAKMGQCSASVGQASGHDADEAPRCGAHFQHQLGLCWAMLTHREQQERKKNVKNTGFSGSCTWGRLRFLLRRSRLLFFWRDTALTGRPCCLGRRTGCRSTSSCFIPLSEPWNGVSCPIHPRKPSKTPRQALPHKRVPSTSCSYPPSKAPANLLLFRGQMSASRFSIFWEGRHCQGKVKVIKIIIGQTRCACPTFGHGNHSLMTNVVFEAYLLIPVSLGDNPQGRTVKASCGLKGGRGRAWC